MKCRFCGKEVELTSRSKTKDVCQDKACKRKRANEVQMKYLEKKKQLKVDTKETEENVNANKIVCERPLKQGHGYMIEYARKFGSIVYDLIEEAKDTREKIKYFDELEQDLLHTLENMEQLKEVDAIQMSVMLKKSRNERRFYKDKIFLLQSFLNGILIKEPEKFVRTGIDMIKNSTYNYKVMEDMLDKNSSIEKQDQKQSI